MFISQIPHVFFIHQYLLITVTCVRVITSPCIALWWIRSTLDVGQIPFYSCTITGPGVGVVAHKYVAIRWPQFYFLDDKAAHGRSDPQITKKMSTSAFILFSPTQQKPPHTFLCKCYTHQEIKTILISQFCYYYFFRPCKEKILKFLVKNSKL